MCREVCCYHIVLKDSEMFAVGEGRGHEERVRLGDGGWKIGRTEIVLHGNSVWFLTGVKGNIL